MEEGLGSGVSLFLSLALSLSRARIRTSLCIRCHLSFVYVCEGEGLKLDSVVEVEIAPVPAAFDPLSRAPCIARDSVAQRPKSGTWGREAFRRGTFGYSSDGRRSATEIRGQGPEAHVPAEGLVAVQGEEWFP